MLQRNGYKPILIATETWEPPEDTVFHGVETIKLYPTGQHDPDTKVEQVEEMVELTYKQLKEALPKDARVITHDLIFLPDYTIYNLAARKLAPETDIKWFHWIHSATNPHDVSKERSMFGEHYANALNSPFPNSVICFPNAYDRRRVAANFNFEEDQIIEVPHSTDPTEHMHPLVKRLYDELKLGEVEVLMVYPHRLDRGKASHNNIKFIAACRRIGLKAHLIIPDFQSTGGDKVEYRNELKDLAKNLDVTDRVTFLSEFDDLAQMEVSHDIIMDLFTLSNIFMMPSKSETYSLITQEAMLRGNFCIINHDFMPFRQIFGEQNAIYRQFDGGKISFSGLNGEIETQHGTHAEEFQYWESLAKTIKYWLENDRVLHAKTWVRTQRNPDFIFKEYIEPLLLKDA